MKRVLIYRLGSLGDTVVALPALHVIERAFPAAQRLMLTNVPVHTKAPAAAAVLEGSGLVHGYIRYPMATRSPLKLARIWWQIRRFRPDVVVYLMPSRGEGSLKRDLRFFRFSGVLHIVGLPEGDGPPLRYDAATGLWEQEWKRLLRTVQELGAADGNDLRWWDLRLTEAEKQKARDVLAEIGDRPFIACGPGTKMQTKDWGQENWRILLEKLHREMPFHGLVMVGAREDLPISAAAAIDWKGPVANFCGRLTPRETAAVLDFAELFLGADSGPMHLAASRGVPCAIPFSARDLRGKWYPAGAGHRIIFHTVDCAGCNLVTCIEQRKKCIVSITVDEMFAAAMEAWQNGRKERARASGGSL